MWTPLRKTRARWSRLADNAEDVTKMLAQSTGFVKGASERFGDAVEETGHVVRDVQDGARAVLRRYDRLADTIEAAVIVLTVVAVVCSVATTVKELWSE